MRKRNWSKYNKQLVQRGSLSFLIDQKTLKSLKVKKTLGQDGRPKEYSDQLILLLFTLKTHYSLTYRSLEGFAKSIFKELAPCLAIPNYSLICKRIPHIKHLLPKLSNRRPYTILLDASGVKVYGEGEWKVKIHGRGRPRKWLKIHIAIDAKSQEVVSEVTTLNNVGDSTMTGPLMDQAGKGVKEVLADGAYDGRKCREEIQKRGAQDKIPPPKNAKYRGTNSSRDDAIKLIKALGGILKGRSLWGRLTGYSYRSLVETAFSRLKRLFGDRLFSKVLDNQMFENRVRCWLMNKMLQIKV